MNPEYKGEREKTCFYYRIKDERSKKIFVLKSNAPRHMISDSCVLASKLGEFKLPKLISILTVIGYEAEYVFEDDVDFVI